MDYVYIEVEDTLNRYLAVRVEFEAGPKGQPFTEVTCIVMFELCINPTAEAIGFPFFDMTIDNAYQGIAIRIIQFFGIHASILDNSSNTC